MTPTAPVIRLRNPRREWRFLDYTRGEIVAYCAICPAVGFAVAIFIFCWMAK